MVSALSLLIFFNTQFFKKVSIERRTDLAIPDSTKVIEFQKGESLFAKLELPVNDVALLEEKIINSPQLDVKDKYQHLYPERMVGLCSWWDIEQESIEKEYLLSASSDQIGNFGLRQIFIYFMTPQNDTAIVYIAVIGR